LLYFAEKVGARIPKREAPNPPPPPPPQKKKKKKKEEKALNDSAALHQSKISI
jgi:hypothetical protein